MDELMVKNRPEQTTQTLQEQTSPPQTIVIQCALPELVERLERLEQICSAQSQSLKLLSDARNSYPTRTQMEDLLKSIQHLEAMAEQAGKKKEKLFSFRKFRLPRLHLSLPTWDWTTVLIVVWALVGLFLISPFLVAIWNLLSPMLQ